MNPRLLLAGLLLAALAGCGDSPGIASGGAGFPGAMAETDAAWQVLDLATGAITPYRDPPAGDDHDRLLVLRLVPGGTSILGQADGTAGRQADEARRSQAVAPVYIARCELTRAQWRRLAGDAPWEVLGPAGIAGGDDEMLPATGMSAARAAAVLAEASARLGRRLALPTAAEWETAARAGSAAVMPWGDDLRPSLASSYAWTAATGATAARTVASLLPSALGLYDCLGNVWELTADGGMRGGSWADPLALARPANADALLADDGAPHVGLRPVYRP